jgi:hypothetical protein
MIRRRRLLAACAALAAAVLLSTPAASQAWVTTDVHNWALSETWSSYDGGTQYHISSSGDGSVAYRWLDGNLTRTTIIAGVSCSDYNIYGQSTIGGGDTSYHTLFSSGTGLCFVLRGRTPAGSGSTIPHEGRLRR